MANPKVIERDRENAVLILEQIARLKELGDFAGADATASQITFIALMLRNERNGEP